MKEVFKDSYGTKENFMGDTFDKLIYADYLRNCAVLILAVTE